MTGLLALVKLIELLKNFIVDISKTVSSVHFNTMEVDRELIFQQLYYYFTFVHAVFVISLNLILKRNLLLLGRMKIIRFLGLFQNLRCGISHKKANNFKLDIIF